MSNNTSVTMPVLSWRLLQGLLSQPGWTKSSKDIYVSGKLDAEGKFTFAEPPTGKSETEQKAWADAAHTIELLGKEKDTISRCVKYNVDESKLGGTKYIFAIISNFSDTE